MIEGGVGSVTDSIFNCIPQFRDEIRLEILRTGERATRSSKGEGKEKHEFDVTTSCSFPLMKLDGRFKFTRLRIFHASISIILVWSIMKLLAILCNERNLGWDESNPDLSVSYVTRESETGFKFEANRSGFTTFAFWLTRMEMGQ